MSHPEALRWLHRVGYVATAIVALELVAIGSLATVGWVRDRNIRAAGRESTRTHQGPLSTRAHGLVRDDAQRLLAKLPPLDSLGQDAVRFVAMPSFGRIWFALAVRSNGNQAKGVLVSVQRSGTDDLGAEARRTFSMPLGAYQAVVARVDRFSDGWSGDPSYWTDGTPVAFERTRDAGVTSGIGNSPTHYGKLAKIVRDGLAPYLPEIAALDGEWMERSAA